MELGNFEDRIRRLAGHWLDSLDGLPALRTPGRPQLLFRGPSEQPMTAQILLREQPRIEFFAWFLDAMRDEILRNEVALTRACLPRDLRGARYGPMRGVFLECMSDAVASFALLHELFHLLCGHIEFSRANAGLSGDYRFDEATLGLAPGAQGGSAVAVDDDAVLAAYYVEIEADNTALQWWMQSPPLPALGTLLERCGRVPATPDGRGLNALPVSARRLAFRVLLAATWLSVRLMERARGASLRVVTRTHPFPAARLLAAVATLLEQYATLDEVRVDARGRKLRRMSRRDVGTITSFLRQVLKPALIAPWPVRDHDAAADGFETFPPWIVLDIRNLMLLAPAETEPGRQLERVEQARSWMTARLAPTRYLDFGE